MLKKLLGLFPKKPSQLEYTIVNTKEYKTSLKRLYYYVVVPENADNEYLLQVFKDLDIGNRDEVTVWFYRDDKEVRRCLPYSVAMLARKGKGEPVSITR